MKATFCTTKNGNGYKIAIDGKWLYVKKEYLLKVLLGEATSCHFNTYKDEE